MGTDRLRRSLRATFIGLAANATLGTLKIVAGVFGHSQALIADGVESLADLCSSIVVWRGLVVAAEPADEDHPYGHGKAEPLAAAIVALLLIFASVWITVHSVREIIRPHLAPAPFTLVVLALVVVTKELLFRFVLRESINTDSSAVHCDAWHHRADAITSLCAMVGIGIALIGGPGYEAADDYAAILAAIVIAANGTMLLKPALNELMDRTPSIVSAEEIRAVALRHAQVNGVEKCLVRKVGNHIYVEMHVRVSGDMTVRDGHVVAHEVKDAIREKIPVVRDVLVHIEPA